MMSIKWFIFLLLLTQANTATQELDVTTTRQYCGSVLANILSLVCKGKYNTLFDVRVPRSKRRVEEYEYPFKSKENTFTLLRSNKRKRGVYNECCVKGCGINELRTYCAPN